MSLKIESKRQGEKDMVSLMISLYCRKKHGGKELCPDCAALRDYAWLRSDKCPFMEPAGPTPDNSPCMWTTSTSSFSMRTEC